MKKLRFVGALTTFSLIFTTPVAVAKSPLLTKGETITSVKMEEGGKLKLTLRYPEPKGAAGGREAATSVDELLKDLSPKLNELRTNLGNISRSIPELGFSKAVGKALKYVAEQRAPALSLTESLVVLRNLNTNSSPDVGRLKDFAETELDDVQSAIQGMAKSAADQRGHSRIVNLEPLITATADLEKEVQAKASR